MNLKIEQLIEDCTEATEIVNPETGITHHREFFDKEKFAELIIQQCINIVDNTDLSRVEGPDAEDVLYVSVKQIKEHFGVE